MYDGGDDSIGRFEGRERVEGMGQGTWGVCRKFDRLKTRTRSRVERNSIKSFGCNLRKRTGKVGDTNVVP